MYRFIDLQKSFILMCISIYPLYHVCKYEMKHIKCILPKFEK